MLSRGVANVLALALVALTGLVVVVEGRLTEKFVWNELHYNWPSAEVKEAALASEQVNFLKSDHKFPQFNLLVHSLFLSLSICLQFVPKNNLPLGLDVWRNKMFITIPR